MPEVSLQGSGIVSPVGQCEPAGVTQHVRVDLEWHPSLDASPLHHSGEASRGERTSAFAGEHER